ncbi:AAA family ATPase [Streptacidiphilus sp. PAMC 29251]
MYVSRVRVDGVLGFHGDRAVDLELTRPDGSHAGWTVLAGRNGSGKTTLLRAVAVALNAPAQAYPLAPDLQSWQSAEPGRIELTVALDETDADYLPGEASGARSVAVACAWSPAEGRGSAEGRSPAEGRGRSARAQVRWSWTPTSGAPGAPGLTESDWGNASAGFHAGYGPFRRLARRFQPEVTAFTTLFDDDAALAEGIPWLVAEHHRGLEGRPGAAENVANVLRFLGDGLLPDGIEVLRVDSEGLWVEQDGREFSLNELSGGHRTAVALVLNLLWESSLRGMEPELDRRNGLIVMPYPGIVLIDEVDAHLHVTWQQRLGGWLKAHFPEVQFIVTTHSPYICQAADPGGLIRLGAAGDGTAPEVVSEELYQRVVYGSGDDAVLSELFGLESPYSAEAQAGRRRIGDLEGRVLQGDATTAELAEYEALSQKLTSSLSARVDEVAARLARSE